jgi:type II secretory pathway pseudopilin PulG
MARNSRGVSLPETLVSMALFASISATATSLFLTFNHYYTQSLKNLDRARTANQILSTIRSSRLSDMILPPTTGAFYIPNGPVNTQFTTSTISARWTWGGTSFYMARVEPQLYGLTKTNGICIPELYATAYYNKETEVLTFRYSRTGEGDVLQCLGGNKALEEFGTYTWKNVQGVEIVKSDDSGLTLWLKYGDEWFSSGAGEIE